MPSKTIRSFELPQKKYALLQEVKLRLHHDAGARFEGVLTGDEPLELHDFSSGELSLIRQLAEKHGVNLPPPLPAL